MFGDSLNHGNMRSKAMGRRANGEGSIHQRKDGRWQASLSLPTGKRQHFLGKTWEEAHAKLTVAKKNLMDGRPTSTERQTVLQYLRRWLDDTGPSRKPRTNTRYRELVELHVLPHIGRVLLSKLGPQDLQGVYARGLKAGLSPTTVNQVHAILHVAFKQAVGWDLMYRNPTDYVTKPRAEYKETIVLSPDQVRRFIDAATGTRYEALFVLAVLTGMREGEILGLRWRDVDLDEGLIHVRHSLQRIDGYFQLVEPKSAKSRRTIAIGAIVIEALRRHRKSQAEERLKMGPSWEDRDLVFSNELGKPVEVSNLTQRHFRLLLEQAVLPRIRFHDLRHTAATIMLAAHGDVKVVSETLGHSQSAFTMDRYQHVARNMQSEAARAVEVALGL